MCKASWSPSVGGQEPPEALRPAPFQGAQGLSEGDRWLPAVLPRPRRPHHHPLRSWELKLAAEVGPPAQGCSQI